MTQPHDLLSIAETTTLLDEHSPNIDVSGEWSIKEHFLQGGVSQDVRVIELSNGPLQVWVLPTRGMGIWKAEYNGLPIGWDSPVSRPVHPQYVNLQSRNGLGWLDGFNELVCRCGLSFNGPPGHDEAVGTPIESDLTLHGKIANTPAHSVQVFFNRDKQTIGVSGIVEETTLFGPQLRMASSVEIPLNGSAIHLNDEIENIGPSTTELQLLYHVNFGRPFLEEGSQVLCPTKMVVPRDTRAGEGIKSFETYLAPTDGYAEQVYYYDLLTDDEDRTLALLKNQQGNLGVSVHFQREQLPCFAVWKCTQPESAGYVTGLEPSTNFPNFKAFERHHQRVVSLDSKGRYSTQLEIGVHASTGEVQQIQEQIEAIQSQFAPKVFTHPTGPFCSVD